MSLFRGANVCFHYYYREVLFLGVLNDIVLLLNCTLLPPLPLSLQRWFVNGEVECFTGGHVALGLLAILVLLVSLLLIPFVFLLATGRVKKVGFKFYLHMTVP